MDEKMKQIVEFAFNHADAHLTTTERMHAAVHAALAEQRRRDAEKPAPTSPLDEAIWPDGLPNPTRKQMGGTMQDECRVQPSEQPPDVVDADRDRDVVDEMSAVLNRPQGTWADVLAVAREGWVLSGEYEKARAGWQRALDRWNETNDKRNALMDEVSTLKQQLASRFTMEQVETAILDTCLTEPWDTSPKTFSNAVRARLTAPKQEQTPMEREPHQHVMLNVDPGSDERLCFCGYRTGASDSYKPCSHGLDPDMCKQCSKQEPTPQERVMTSLGRYKIYHCGALISNAEIAAEILAALEPRKEL